MAPEPTNLPHPRISIYTHFWPTAAEIEYYMSTGCTSIIDDPNITERVRDSYQKLKNLIETCLRERTTRIFVLGKKKELVSVALFGRFGYLIAETEHYSEAGFETEAEKLSMHMKTLASYAKWICVLHTGCKMQDPVPNTACLVYNPGPHSEYPVLAAMSPNLSGVGQTKTDGRGIQQENLQSFLEELGVSLNFKKRTPEAKNGGGHLQFGECAEILALLHVFNAKTTAHYYLNGMAANVNRMLSCPKEYHEAFFKTSLKVACLNCQHVFRLINSAAEHRVGNLPRQSFASTQGLLATQPTTGFSAAHPPSQDSQDTLSPQGFQPNFSVPHQPAQNSKSTPPPQEFLYDFSVPRCPAQASAPGVSSLLAKDSLYTLSPQEFQHDSSTPDPPAPGSPSAQLERNSSATDPPVQGSHEFSALDAPTQGSLFSVSAQSLERTYSAADPPAQGSQPGLHGPTYTAFTLPSLLVLFQALQEYSPA
ncbi:hypothetical protein B0H12DRAFT_1066966 [Mycena haematopus]|nr:hypothetical protein B0H12DRAFT_1066966 [Mycena haematopus]